jgi:hypothetical protein
MKQKGFVLVVLVLCVSLVGCDFLVPCNIKKLEQGIAA